MKASSVWIASGSALAMTMFLRPRNDVALCHCERSAAIQGDGLLRLDCFVAPPSQ
ncbi:MAG: hypothetical protein LBT00_04445 [Spirochaetaceae bacterium]|nr:hypothetical protein [Spirochaetaceae bacterium]